MTNRKYKTLLEIKKQQAKGINNREISSPWDGYIISKGNEVINQ